MSLFEKLADIVSDGRSIMVRSSREIDNAFIFDQKNNPTKEIERHIIDLTNARDRKDALKISYPFKCAYIETASDSSANIFLLPHTQNDFQSEIRLTRKDSFKLKEIISGCALFWDAQAGKSIALILIRNGDITSGSLNADIAGSIEATILQSHAPVDVGDTATLIRASNNRTNLIIQNMAANPVYIGDNGVTDEAGANIGTRLNQYDIYIHKNTSAIYGIRGAGLTGLVSVNEERLS